MTETVALEKGWHVARITFEAASPLSCGDGPGQRADNALARDASGLPYVPGPTLQGLLRHFHTGGDDDDLFGPATGSGDHRAARLSFSHAHVHDSADEAVGFPANLSDDLLKVLAHEAPFMRKHVRLDHRHGAQDTGLIERAAVPSGARFSFEVLLHGNAADAQRIDSVINSMMQPDFRIGASGAQGYGKITLVEARRGFFSKDSFEDFRKLREMPLSAKPQAYLEAECTLVTDLRCLVISFALTAANPWRSGQDGAPATTASTEKVADLCPLREGTVTREEDGKFAWQPPKGTDGYVLPGSALRGPLVHRTLYHWNSRNGCLLTDTSSTDDLKRFLDNRTQLENLFGKIEKDGGLASPLLVDDVWIDVKRVLEMKHVKINRHSGGAVDSHLFAEEVIETKALPCNLFVRSRYEGRPALCAQSREAFLAALFDLLNGRLALGAKSYGFCTGSDPTFEGPGAKDWQDCWTTVASSRGKQDAALTPSEGELA